MEPGVDHTRRWDAGKTAGEHCCCPSWKMIQTWCCPLGSPDSVNHTLSPEVGMATARGRSGVKYALNAS